MRTLNYLENYTDYMGGTSTLGSLMDVKGIPAKAYGYSYDPLSTHMLMMYRHMDWKDFVVKLDSQTISQGVSRKQVTLSETNDFELEAKGYQVYVKGSFSEEKLGEEPTNLSHVQRRYIPNDTIYSLSGRAMDHCSLMPSGIYIQNGRKIIYRKRGQDNRL